jgi:hypothetical protein
VNFGWQLMFVALAVAATAGSSNVSVQLFRQLPAQAPSHETLQ